MAATTGGLKQALLGGPRTWDRRGRSVLVVAVLVLVGAAAFKGYRLTLPTDGWSLTPPVEMPTFDEPFLDQASPLRPGDVLVGIDGVPYFEVIGAVVRGRKPGVEYRAGLTSTYTVPRDGAEVEVQVPIRHWSVGGVAHAAWRTLVNTSHGGVYRWLAFAIALYVFLRRPRNLSAGLLFLLESVTLALAIGAMVAPVTVADAMSPALFYASRMSGDLVSWLLLPAIALHFLLVFPDTRSVRRWLLALVYGVPWLVFGAVWLTGLADLVPWMSIAYSAANVVALVHLVVRHGSGSDRARVRWLAFGFGLSSLASLAFWAQHVGYVQVSPAVAAVLFRHCLCDLLYVTCIAIALLRHRLFDIDVIIRRALVFFGLTLGVIAIYSGLVIGFGRLVGDRAGLPLTLGATVVVALAFGPLRARLQQGANRLVYGYRDEPIRLLAMLGARLESSGRQSQVLDDAAHALVAALKLPYVAVEVDGATIASAGQPAGSTESVPLSRAGKLVGALVVSPRPGEERLPPADRRLLTALSGHVASAVHANGLEADLVRSRLASLNAREEARRRLGSDLHDDVGHRLTALVHRAERIERIIDADVEASRRALRALVEDVKATAARVRNLAHEIHPPELALLGLVEAVKERMAVMETSHELRLQLLDQQLGELPAAVELGVYSIVQEALANVTRHANAKRCWVAFRLRGDADGGAPWPAGRVLEVEMRDDGVGWRAGSGTPGLGLASMLGRAHELGGTLGIDQPATGGTRVRLSIPLPPPEAPGSTAAMTSSVSVDHQPGSGA